MRVVIGEYESWAAAERAVHAVESQISILTMVIGDQREHRWQRRSLKREHSGDVPHGANFVVSMSGTRENIDRARRLLHPEKAANR
jgi:hypothetical protein